MDHPDTVEHYRAAHTLYLAQEKADIGTEAQRQAFVHYRALFEQLLGADHEIEKDTPKEARHDNSRRAGHDSSDANCRT